MDPFNMPTWGSGFNAQADLQDVVSRVAPLATTYHTAQDIPATFKTNPAPVGESNVSKFSHFVGNVFGETGHLAEGATSWLATNVKNAILAPIHLGTGLGHAIVNNSRLDEINANNQQLSFRLDNAKNAFKSGRMTSEQYKKELAQITQESDFLVNYQTSVDNNLNIDQKFTTKATWDTAALLTTILTAGFGKAATTAISAGKLVPVSEKTAAQFIASKAATPVFQASEALMGKFATDSAAFKALDSSAQWALQRATAEVIATGAPMTAQQIARASAANLALKYPIYFNMISSQADQLYKELDQQKYGDAVRTLAFNAALLLSGGPIGQALKFGGSAVKNISERTFGKTSFWDELSRYYGDGSPAGFRNAVVKATENMTPEARAAYVKDLAAVEATNVAAMRGNAVNGARRVAGGMLANYGADLKTITHEQALSDMVNLAQATRLANETADSLGLGKVAVGRVDARALNEISANLSTAADTETRLSLWETLKQQNPTQAWANNGNFDTQIKNLISQHPDSAELDRAIRSIKAQFQVKGFPRAVAEKLSKMGYIPIKPIVNEAPFKEGGALASKFAQEGDVWTKAVQPVPVLKEIGGLLTGLGLSPNASTQRVYQMFNASLSENLKGLSYVKDHTLVGDTIQQTADDIVKKLSNYMRSPERQGVSIAGANIKLPMTDLRQLSTKDIQRALSIPKSDAKEIGASIMQSMLDVPLAVRGLGDRAVDYANHIPGFSKYLQAQSAGRFAWNPFFKAKVSTKIEILAQSEAGGKFPTILGTNWILKRVFPETYHQIDDARNLLREAGALEQKPTKGLFAETTSGEAADAAANLTEGTTTGFANLHTPLSVAQERSIASLVMTQAKKTGVSLEEFVKDNPSQVNDTVQMIAHYDRNANFLNSPMARTLNYAFFPFRFETKVATIMAKSLAKNDPMTQLAVIKGLYNAHDFLNSPEGQVWYSQNSDVIKVFTFLTPVSTLGEVSNILGGNVHSLADLGELGGLPFGFIPQMLDAAGLTHITQSAYLDPKTANEMVKKVPATTRGQALSAIQSLLGTLFSYPGAQLNLPSKTKMTQAVAFAIGNPKVDLKNAPLEPLTPEQKAYQKAVQQNNAPKPAPVPVVQQQQPVTVPAQFSPLTVPRPPKAKSSGGSGAAHKKKADFRPELLPGQTQLGQL